MWVLFEGRYCIVNFTGTIQRRHLVLQENGSSNSQKKFRSFFCGGGEKENLYIILLSNKNA